MKNILSWATLVAVCAGLQFSPSKAAAQRSDESPQVAILDLTYIYANHTRFKALNEEMRRDVEAAEADLKVNREELEKMNEKLADYRRNSPEYRDLEERIAQDHAKLTANVQLQKKAFMEQEARNYYTVYLEVTDAVKRYSDQHGIVLVLRFNGDPIDAEKPEDVIKQINNVVQHYHKDIDITPHILRMVNGKKPATTPQQPRVDEVNRKKTGVPTKR